MRPFKIPILGGDGVNTGKMQTVVGTKRIPVEGGYSYVATPQAFVVIHKDRFVDESGDSHTLRTEKDGKMYQRSYGLYYKGHQVYYFNTLAIKDDDGIHVGMTWKQRQKFHWMQGDHWFRKEENIRYLVNMLFLCIGVCLSIFSLLRTH